VASKNFFGATMNSAAYRFVASSGGSYRKLVKPTRFFGKVFKNVFSHRRAANISKTNE
jgi:hypothetical protein